MWLISLADIFSSTNKVWIELALDAATYSDSGLLPWERIRAIDTELKVNPCTLCTVQEAAHLIELLTTEHFVLKLVVQTILHDFHQNKDNQTFLQNL